MVGRLLEDRDTLAGFTLSEFVAHLQYHRMRYDALDADERTGDFITSWLAGDTRSSLR